jgi:glucose/arabinose dehydrogenase
VQHPTNADRWYVVEQRGKIFTFLASNPAGTLTLAIDLETSINLSTGGEQGLLNLAFSPDFASNGEVFLTYTQSGPSDHVLARFVVSADGMTIAPSGADPTVLRFAQEQANHNGGDLAFGPDGLLYYSMGDGGGAGDPNDNAQNLTSLYGKILRLDVSVAPYAIPPDNPFVGSAGLDEIWAYGLRNPWRMSFDRQTGELWVGDVGQSAKEEIDRVVKGGNYGWNCREGDEAFDPGPQCSPPFVEPEVVHGRGEAQAITGGYVYRGSAIPALAGAYVYGDFASGHVWAYYFNANPGRVDELSPPAGLNVSSFGEDGSGELYAIDYSGTPSIYKLAP